MVGLDSYRVCKEKTERLDIGVNVNILSLDDLIVNKRLVNRKTDVSDIDELNKINQKRHRRRM
jgi:hypothetical protein